MAINEHAGACWRYVALLNSMSLFICWQYIYTSVNTIGYWLKHCTEKLHAYTYPHSKAFLSKMRLFKCWCVCWQSSENASAVVELNTPLKFLLAAADFSPTSNRSRRSRANNQSQVLCVSAPSAACDFWRHTCIEYAWGTTDWACIAIIIIHPSRYQLRCGSLLYTDEFARQNPRRLQLWNLLYADLDDWVMVYMHKEPS